MRSDLPRSPSTARLMGPSWIHLSVLAALAVSLCVGCPANQQASGSSGTGTVATGTDSTDAIFAEQSGDCADYADNYSATVTDIQRAIAFVADIDITFNGLECCR